VGTGYFDQVAQVVSGGLASTLALAESTETAQF
jgi:isocitrate lyase